MKLHRFNPDGMAAFETYRARLTLESTLPAAIGNAGRPRACISLTG